MADLRVRFQCGCVFTVDVDAVSSPRCPEHGQRASGVVKAPAPRFKGYVKGPNATPAALPAIPVKVATKPLPALKDPLADNSNEAA